MGRLLGDGTGAARHDEIRVAAFYWRLNEAAKLCSRWRLGSAAKPLPTSRRAVVRAANREIFFHGLFSAAQIAAIPLLCALTERFFLGGSTWTA